jgi:fatty-acyl-CoA synthase
VAVDGLERLIASTSGAPHIDGRDDDMIVSGGENVYPLEVENLIGGHPHVDDVAVVGVPDFGQRLEAYGVLSDGASVDAGTIKDYVRAGLARCKVPGEGEFRAGLPRNATGKLLRSRLEAGALK